MLLPLIRFLNLKRKIPVWLCSVLAIAICCISIIIGIHPPMSVSPLTWKLLISGYMLITSMWMLSRRLVLDLPDWLTQWPLVLTEIVVTAMIVGIVILVATLLILHPSAFILPDERKPTTSQTPPETPPT